MRRSCAAVVALTAGWGGVLVPAAVAQQEAFPFSDTFDSYAPGVFPCTGAGCNGPNGWAIWHSGGTPGTIVAGAAHSGANYLQMAAGTDIVQTGSATSGVWTVRAWLYIPTGDAGNVYFILMNGYGTTATNSWTVEIEFNGTTGNIRDNINGTYPYPTAGTGPIIGTLVRDVWAELRAEVNLGTNRWDLYYNGVQIRNQAVYAPPAAPNNAPAIVCLDLYSSTSAGSRFDTVSVEPQAAACYANCDSSTQAPVLNVQDFSCFLTRYAAGESYANCDSSTQAPVLNVQDFSCYLTKYAAGCP